MKYNTRIFKPPSADYERALDLRYRILRQPLGLHFTETELEKDKADTHLGFFEGENIVACLILCPPAAKRMKMRQVAVNECHQRKGVGRQLSEVAELFAMQHGAEVIFCHARKTAVPFYVKLGYRIISEEFTEVNIPHYVMEKQLLH